jgi:hypothetical protein
VFAVGPRLERDLPDRGKHHPGQKLADKPKSSQPDLFVLKSAYGEPALHDGNSRLHSHRQPSQQHFSALIRQGRYVANPLVSIDDRRRDSRRKPSHLADVGKK